MWQTIKTNALAFHASFHKSGTIVFARLQVLLGAVWTVLTMADLAPLISNPKYLTGWLLFSGVVTELTRRSRTDIDDEGHLVPHADVRQSVPAQGISVSNPSGATPVPPVVGPTSGNTK